MRLRKSSEFMIRKTQYESGEGKAMSGLSGPVGDYV